MKQRLPFLCLAATLLIFSACSSEPAAPSAADTPAAPAPSAEGLTGTWSGDWGPSARDRNDVKLELKWDGTTLTGTVNPDSQPIQLTSASYAADTGVIKMEADATGYGGAAVHYVIEGKVEGTSMSGSWNHDNRKGDFKISKQ